MVMQVVKARGDGGSRRVPAGTFRMRHAPRFSGEARLALGRRPPKGRGTSKGPPTILLSNVLTQDLVDYNGETSASLIFLLGMLGDYQLYFQVG